MEVTIVRDNLIKDKEYRPYCGAERCKYHNPRTEWDKLLSQFICGCGWISAFPIDFIERYKNKHSIN